jgi:hypothetical protein
MTYFSHDSFHTFVLASRLQQLCLGRSTADCTSRMPIRHLPRLSNGQGGPCLGMREVAVWNDVMPKAINVVQPQ